MIERKCTQKWVAVLAVVVFLGLIQGTAFPQEEKQQPRRVEPALMKPFNPTVTSTVGEKKNYNLRNYTQYGVSTIEWVKTEKCYQARIGFTGPEGFVFFSSFHQTFADAQYTINFVKDGKASGKLYNIFAETINVHNTPTPGPNGETTVVEVLSLIYSFTL